MGGEASAVRKEDRGRCYFGFRRNLVSKKYFR